MMRISISLFALLLITGCAQHHPKGRIFTSAMLPETVQITYHVIPGKEKELEQLLTDIWEVYRNEMLVYAEPHVVIRDNEAENKARIVETFTWFSADDPDHAPESVTSRWGKMTACCESRNGHPGLEINPVILLTPSSLDASR